MCYDSSYYEWVRRAAQAQERQKREEETRRRREEAASPRPAEPEKGVGQEEPVPA